MKPDIKLTELNPRFLGHGGEGVTSADGSPVPRREGVGVMFDCPCGCESPVFVYLQKPLDGGPPVETKAPKWDRAGDTFEDLTLSPSLQRVGGCETHGWVKNGKWVWC